ncbi:hypothetical protein [Acidomonas methanolica]|uniref:Uncharacterized protein n=1 Tax=Acidomonas methanolica NBRC 104435 TaxID=1231351 RepID=A0A023D8W3_ACIMT|nr:hypothetical protein [Acidomonas methanolica]MBU2655850.1 hypothetical protein [Acidomonas methanolica]MCQ9156945.1 hypothetical protein [Acidomonas methanolica]GAJ30564.1 hypothetical protein Amme_174_003 [Acidomonas methanolica NBRC 104435]
MSISGVAAIVFLLAACLTMSIDDSNHFHVNLPLIVASVLSSFVFLWTIGRS